RVSDCPGQQRVPVACTEREPGLQHVLYAVVQGVGAKESIQRLDCRKLADYMHGYTIDAVRGLCRPWALIPRVQGYVGFRASCLSLRILSMLTKGGIPSVKLRES